MDIREIFSIKSIRSILMGLGAAIVLMLIISLLASIIVYNSKMLDSNLIACAIIVEAIAVLGGSYVAARLNGSRGLIIGLTCGLFIFLFMLIFNSPGGISPFIKLLYCSLLGMAGGFLGIK